MLSLSKHPALELKHRKKNIICKDNVRNRPRLCENAESSILLSDVIFIALLS